MKQVVLLDTGGANIASLQFALERHGATSVLTTDHETIRAADRVILPGVGAAADAMARLEKSGLCDLIRSLTQPVLGICLGMQLLASRSAEDDTACLGLIDAEAQRLTATPQHPVPNMGWCPARLCRESPLFAGIPDMSYFYFLHSYALPTDETTIAQAAHIESFSAAMNHANFHATQFHPERSSDAGARLLANFLEMT